MPQPCFFFTGLAELEVVVVLDSVVVVDSDVVVLDSVVVLVVDVVTEDGHWPPVGSTSPWRR